MSSDHPTQVHQAQAAVRQRTQVIDLQSHEFKKTPETTWRTLLEQAPVVTTRQPLLGRVAFATRYEEAQSVLRNTELFSVDARRCGHKYAAGMRWWVPGIFKPLANNLLTLDGEEHRSLRKRVDFAFRKSELSELQPQIELVADAAINNFNSAIRQHGYADFVEHVARPVPQWVISHLLGLDAAYAQPDNELNRALSVLGSVHKASDIFRAVPAIRTITNTLKNEFRSRRAEPRNDLLTRLISQQGEGRALTDEELLAMTFLLYVAGHETTTHLLSSSLLSILSKPYIKEQIEKPLQDKDIHEFVRFNSPVQMSKPRFVLQDINFAGAHLHRGDTIAALIGSANRDHRMFTDPDLFLLERASARHLGFGTGIHTCFGLHLALRETSMVLNRVLFDSPLKLANRTTTHEWNRRLGLSSLQTLMLSAAQ